MYVSRVAFGIAIPGMALLLAGCAGSGAARAWNHRERIKEDAVACVRVLADYMWYDGCGHRGRMAPERVARLSRMFHSTLTEEDLSDDELPYVNESRGAVLEILEPNEAREILRLVDVGIAEHSFAPVMVTVPWTGEIRFEWQEDGLWHGASVWWLGTHTYAVNAGEPNELWFGCPELTKKLVSLASRESIRTWIWSNPELQDPEELPDWYVKERDGDSNPNTDE